MKNRKEIYQMFLNQKYLISNEFELIAKEIYKNCDQQVIIKDDEIHINKHIVVDFEDFFAEYLHFTYNNQDIKIIFIIFVEESN